MCESKGPVPNVLKGGALGWELLCLFWKRIMSSSQCQGYYIYKALQFFGWYSKCYARFTYVFSLTSRRGKKPSSNGSVSGKGSWPVHSSHSSFRSWIPGHQVWWLSSSGLTYSWYGAFLASLMHSSSSTFTLNDEMVVRSLTQLHSLKTPPKLQRQRKQYSTDGSLHTALRGTSTC